MTGAAKTRSLVVEREIAHPPEKIWRALTQPHLIAEWMMNNDFKPVEGHHFKLTRQPTPEVNVVIDCEVLTVEPHKTLAYTWKAFGFDGTVTFTLTPTSSGTRLRVEQAGFQPDQQQALKGGTAAWHGFMASLADLLSRID